MLKILYLGNSPDCKLPSDRRRSFGFLKRINIKHKLYIEFQKGVNYDILISTIGADLNKVLIALPFAKKFVFDYSDNYLLEKSLFKNYLRLPINSLINKSRFCFKSYQKTVVELLTYADLVIYPSIDYKELLSRYNCKIFRITDFLETEVPKSIPNITSNSLFWEGLSCNVSTLKDVCRSFHLIKSPKLNVVTDPYYGPFSGKILKYNTKKKLHKYYKNIRFYEWSHDNLSNAIKRSSLGIIPLNRSNRFLFTKPENKLVFMWFMGLPAITSDSNSYCMLENKIGFNFTVSDKSDWNESIESFLGITNSKEISDSIKNFAFNNYSDSIIMQNWIDALESFCVI